MSDNPRHSGLAVILGRPNVGKSTLINALVGEKVSIVTHKAQTTRHRIVGLLTRGNTQIGLVDTPGLHRGGGHALNRVMNETATGSVAGVDLALLVVEAGRWRDEDAQALSVAASGGVPVGLIVNKVDRVTPREALLPFIESVGREHDFAFVVPLSARREDNLEPLVDEIARFMPAGEFLFDDDQLSDRDLRFMVAETVREKLTLLLHQELPYSLAVNVDAWEEVDGLLRIGAVIWVARDSQKAIVIGSGGATLKEVGRRARLELARRLDRRLHLSLWVKVREHWPDDEAAVRGFGH